MKTLNFYQIENVYAGNGRTCMILGGLALAGAIGGFFAPPLWGGALAVTGQAAVYGCFN